jgi:catechol 2,3-dioxygenase-like lactoylglutathione lyase family enzyme
MTQSLALISLLVRDYDEAIAFYTEALGFRLLEDNPLPAQNKRWVVVAPEGPPGSALLLARASTDEQVASIGNQGAGRVFLFLHTNDLARDYALYRSRGVNFVREPIDAAYGTVAVFQDLYGNLWDLIEAKLHQ